MAAIQGHILVVDDNRINRIKLRSSLEQEGHTVGMAEDGRQALDMVRSEAFDLVLLDIIMPEMDGYEVLAAIKGDPLLRDIPVIVISALDEMDSVVRCIEMGAEDYLPKPFNPVLLKARLDTCLEKKKLRDLERAYLQQEVTLRQSEKLATLGRLSAGMAHELNNPASAAQRGIGQLRQAMIQLQQGHLQLDGLGVTEEQRLRLLALDQLAQTRASQPLNLSSLIRSDREYELEAWLDEHNVDNGWELSPTLVSLGYETADLERLAQTFTAAKLPVVILWLNSVFTIYSLLQEIGEGTGRIVQIVNALKTYAYLDQAPIQTIDVHEGLENTLTMLQSKLPPGVTVFREYAPDLPPIQAYGSELNQVWTNMVDNAIQALNGEGLLTLRTRHEGQEVIVEIEDSGPGIPAAIQGKIFDPFFTTRPPGAGTGLGLNICHNIVVHKHRGKIAVQSQPGHTCFRVSLPLNFEESG